jgi:hypothetical protein
VFHQHKNTKSVLVHQSSGAQKQSTSLNERRSLTELRVISRKVQKAALTACGLIPPDVSERDTKGLSSGIKMGANEWPKSQT